MANMNLYSRGDKVFVRLNMVLITVFALSTLYPFIYIAAVSFSNGSAASAGTVFWRPLGLTISAYDYVMSEPLFWSSYKNTFIYTFGGTLVSMLIIVPGAYALSKPQLLGRRYFNLFVAFTMWFNAGLIPFFLNMRDLGLMDSYFGLIIAFACNAFNIILLRNFFEAIPKSFEEAARMDGANEFHVLWKVYLPLSKPALATIILFCMVARWNGFFWAMLFFSCLVFQNFCLCCRQASSRVGALQFSLCQL